MPDTSNQAIGRRLVAVREARGHLQATMAKLMDVSYQRWGNYERGERFPPPDLLARFWQLTGATSDFILFGHMNGLPYELAEKLRATASKKLTDTKDAATG
nr:helix-turn-helix transcriptional regulator [Devosia yakushimensis]